MNPRRIIATSFVLVYVAISVLIGLVSRENRFLAYGALTFLLLGLSLLRLSYSLCERMQSEHKTTVFALCALVITMMSIPICWCAEQIAIMNDANRTANFRATRVTDLHDELLLTERNDPVGLRLHYTVIVPRSGRYDPVPSVGDGRTHAGHFWLSAVTVDPRPDLESSRIPLAGRYKAGVSYKIVADLKPSFLLFDQQTRTSCVHFVSSEQEDLVKRAAVGQRFEVDIAGTSLSRYHGEGLHHLEHEYSLRMFYDSIARESIPRCTDY